MSCASFSRAACSWRFLKRRNNPPTRAVNTPAPAPTKAAESANNSAAQAAFIQADADSYPDPLPSPLTPEALAQAREAGHLDALLSRLSDGIGEAVVDWLNGIDGLADQADFSRLTCAVAEVGSHLVSVPLTGMLPTLSGPKDGIALNLGRALGAMDGQTCAMKTLIETFRFLGGKFVEHAAFAVDLPGEPPPEGRMERWAWLCRSSYAAKDEAEGLWQRLIDPIQ